MSKCRGCGAEIVWARTDRGRDIPLDAKPEKRFELSHGHATLMDTYVSHFVTCPKAKEFRHEPVRS